MGKNRYGVEIKPAKYHAGISVIVTFPKVSGLKKTSIRAYIRSVRGRFLDTPALANFRYELILDEKYCSSISFTVPENMIKEAPHG